MKILPLLVVAALLAPAANAAPKPTWKTFADCAAAYQANADLKDPERSKSMTQSIQDVAEDYRGAALSQRKPRNDAAVAAYIAGRVPVFAAKPRAEVERFIEACPPTDL